MPMASVYRGNTQPTLLLTAQSHVYRYHSTTQSLATSGTAQTLVFDTSVESVGTDISYSAGTFTINATGRYHISAVCSHTGNATGSRGCLIFVNGVQVMSQLQINSGASDVPAPSCSVDMDITAGQTVLIKGYQTSGGALNAVGGQGITCVSISRLY